MAIYQVQAPDGHIIKLEGPEGASQDEIIKQAQSLYKPTAAAETPAKDAGVLGAVGRTALGVAQGAVVDPLLGVTQLIGHLIGQGKTVDELVNKESEAYKAIRKELGGEGADVARIVGMVAPALVSGGATALGKGAGIAAKASRPLTARLAEEKAAEFTAKAAKAASESKPLAAKLFTEKAAKLAPQATEMPISAIGDIATKFTTPINVAERFAPNAGYITRGALTGAEQSLLAPVVDEQGQKNYATSKLSNLAFGAGLGGAFAGLPKGLRTETGSIGEELASRGKGTLGQQINSPTLQKFERNIAANVPVVGPQISKKFEEGLKEASELTSKGYNKLYEGAAIKHTPEFENISKNLIATARDRIKTGTVAGKEDAETLIGLAQYIKTNIGPAKPHYIATPTGPQLVRDVNKIEGRDIYNIIQNLKAEKELAFRKGNFAVSDQLKDTINKMKAEISAQNPNFAKELKKLDKYYSAIKGLKKEGTKELPSLGRYGLGLGELGYAIAGGPGSIALLTGNILPGLSLIPKTTRTGLGALGQAAVPYTFAQDRMKEGGSATKKDSGPIKGTPLARYYGTTLGAIDEPGLEAPMFAPDDLIGTGIGKGALALGAGIIQPTGKLLRGMPELVKVGKDLVPYGTSQEIVDIAKNYAAKAGIPYKQQETYAPLIKERGEKLAKAYADMAHAPNDPAVKKAYNALADETMGQYEALRKAGYKFDFMPEGRDIYGNPRKAIDDLLENKRMSVFPTESGFGSLTGAAADNPLLIKTGEKWGGLPVTVNDVFRAVHDVFGHAKHGVGFRGRGEENAWQAHQRLFSKDALPALTSETRGQNSWVNFGPYGKQNLKASPANTIYADQKTGLLPSWAWEEGIARKKGGLTWSKN